MSNEVRNTSIRDQASRLLLDIARDLRKQAQEHRGAAQKADDAAQAIEALLGAERRVRALHRVASSSTDGKRPSVPKPIRAALEKAATDLEKQAARIKAVPVTATERTLKQTRTRKEA